MELCPLEQAMWRTLESSCTRCVINLKEKIIRMKFEQERLKIIILFIATLSLKKGV